ncbi:hypothetical protein R6Q59_036770 [Mikania micrantha]
MVMINRGPRLATNITISGGGRRAHKPRSKSPCTTSHDFGHEVVVSGSIGGQIRVDDAYEYIDAIISNLHTHTYVIQEDEMLAKVHGFWVKKQSRIWNQDLRNVLKDLHVSDMEDFVTSLVYEASSRLREPKQGCLGYIRLHKNRNSKSTIQDLGALTVLPSNLNLEGTFNHPQPDQQLLEEEQRKILVKSYFEIKKMHEANIEHRSALNLGPIQQHNKVDFYEVGPFGQQILYAFESGWNMLE